LKVRNTYSLKHAADNVDETIWIVFLVPVERGAGEQHNGIGMNQQAQRLLQGLPKPFGGLAWENRI